MSDETTRIEDEAEALEGDVLDPESDAHDDDPDVEAHRFAEGGLPSGGLPSGGLPSGGLPSGGLPS